MTTKSSKQRRPRISPKKYFFCGGSGKPDAQAENAKK